MAHNNAFAFLSEDSAPVHPSQNRGRGRGRGKQQPPKKKNIPPKNNNNAQQFQPINPAVHSESTEEDSSWATVETKGKKRNKKKLIAQALKSYEPHHQTTSLTIHVLPLEMLTHLFTFLTMREILYPTSIVCSYWKDECKKQFDEKQRFERKFEILVIKKFNLYIKPSYQTWQQFYEELTTLSLSINFPKGILLDRYHYYGAHRTGRSSLIKLFFGDLIVDWNIGSTYDSINEFLLSGFDFIYEKKEQGHIKIYPNYFKTVDDLDIIPDPDLQDKIEMEFTLLNYDNQLLEFNNSGIKQLGNVFDLMNFFKTYDFNDKISIEIVIYKKIEIVQNSTKSYDRKIDRKFFECSLVTWIYHVCKAMDNMLKNKSKKQYLTAWDQEYGLKWNKLRSMKAYLPWFSPGDVPGLAQDWPTNSDDWIYTPVGSHQRKKRRSWTWHEWDIFG